jgi:hypothetical protein
MNIFVVQRDGFSASTRVARARQWSRWGVGRIDVWSILLTGDNPRRVSARSAVDFASTSSARDRPRVGRG